MSAEDLARLDAAHVWHPYTQMAAYEPLVLAAGHGCHVVDVHGGRWVDAISGLWNVQVGHGRSEIVDAAAAAMAALAYTPLNGRAHVPGVELAAELARLAPGRLSRVFYVTGGAEGVETAVKMARQFWRLQGHAERHVVIGLDRGWHGCTLGALSAGGVTEEKEPYGPLAPGFHQVPPSWCYRCPHRSAPSCPVDTGEALASAIAAIGADRVAAVVAEPMLGLGGMVVPDPGFWPAVQAVCRATGVLLVVDEVATGFGRTGRMFACEHFAVEPDLLVVSKGITSGYLPLGAVLATDRVYDAFLGGPDATFSHGYTFGGHPAACAAALANLAIIEREDLCRRAEEVGGRLVGELRDRLAGCPVVGEVRGLGLAIGIELVADRATREPLPVAPELCDLLGRRRVLARPVGGGAVLPLLPPLCVPDDVAAELVDAYVEVVETVAARAPARA